MKAVLITSSILIVLIAALRPILRGKIDPRVQYALWLVIALRLLVPVNLVTSAYSALALLERSKEPSQIIETIGQAAIPVQSYDSARAQVVEDYRQQGVPDSALTPGDLMDIDSKARELMRGPTIAELAQKLAVPVWLGGAVAMALWFGFVNLRLRKKLKGAAPVDADCPLPVYVSDALPSPCLCGVVRPAVYVTPAALEHPERLRHVLAHELTHYRHRDHWWALVRCLCLCAYWFDPLVWWAAALSRQDCELACDEGAIRRLGEGERLPYGRTLVDMIAAGRTPLLQTATTMAGGKRRVRERVALIARRPKTIIAAALALVVVLALAVGCTFTGAPEGGKPMPATVDNLRERLEDIPAELRDRVTYSLINDEPGHLADYWFDIPAEWTDMELWGGYMLSVGQVDEADLESIDFMDYRVFARTEDHYYATFWCNDGRFEGYPEYWDAVDAIRAFAEKTVLETEGVEPYSPDENRQPLGTLQARLLELPEELQADVAVLPPDGGGDSPTLATYVLKRPGEALNTDLYLLIVSQITQAEFEQYFYTPQQGGAWCFAKSADRYYTFFWNTSLEYEDEDAERFGNAQRAVNQFAKQAVLETEGVETFDAEKFLSREHLQEGKTYTQVAYWPYKAINGNTDIVWIYWLVQPAEPGPGGVWIPERQQWIDTAVDPTPQHIKPDTGGLTVTQYAQQLQAEADAGRADWATNPIEALRHYEEESSGRSGLPLDSFTMDIDYIQSALEKLQPTPEQEAVQAAVNRLMAAPSVELRLGIASQDAPGQYLSYACSSVPSQDVYAHYLSDLPTFFSLEEFDWGTTANPQFPDTSGTEGYLYITSSNYDTYIHVWKGSDLVAVHDSENGTNWYHARYTYDTARVFSAYEYLRRFWFDPVELDALRAQNLTVPNRGQSHEEIVREWAEGYEGVYTKTAPGSPYACTSMEIIDVNADELNWLSEEELETWCRPYTFTAQDFGKTWFAFSYRTVFVPVDQSTTNGFFVGNTGYYEGGDAPEGALTYSRVGHIWLTDEGWTCTGTGTGW